MPRLRENQAPSYRRHKQSGQAIVTFDGRDVLLGRYGSSESRQKYDRLVAEWFRNGRQRPVTSDHDDERGLSVNDMILAFWDHAQSWYRHVDGTPTSEIDNLRQALRPLRRLYGETTAATFGPKSLKIVRDEMVRLRWARSNINRQVNRIKHVFKWATEEELIPPSVYHGLQAVSGLRPGRTNAKEVAPVTAVPEALVRAVLPHVSRVIAAMIDLQLVTGMRPGEVCAMRGCDIETTEGSWTYRPPQHKTQHHGHAREVCLGPRAQRILRPFLPTDLQAYIFRPASAMEERLVRDHARRVTPLSCGNRPGSNRKRNPARSPGEGYDVAAYRRAIARGCERAFPPPVELLEKNRREELRRWHSEHRWHPHQLRPHGGHASAAGPRARSCSGHSRSSDADRDSGVRRKKRRDSPANHGRGRLTVREDQCLIA